MPRFIASMYNRRHLNSLTETQALMRICEDIFSVLERQYGIQKDYGAVANFYMVSHLKFQAFAYRVLSVVVETLKLLNTIQAFLLHKRPLSPK